jgi:hypothetical protein
MFVQSSLRGARVIARWSSLTLKCNTGWPGHGIAVAAGVFNLKTVASINEALIVIHEHFRLWDDPPFDSEQELEFKHGQFRHANSTNSGIRLVGPKAVAQSLASDSGASDQESMNGQTRHSESGI